MHNLPMAETHPSGDHSVASPAFLEQRRTGPERTDAVSSSDLVALLVRGGGRVVARDDHGCFVHMARRLVFIPSSTALSIQEVRDVRRTCQIGPGRFDRLLAEVRRTPV